LFIRIILNIEKATCVSFSLAQGENIAMLLVKQVYQRKKPMSLNARPFPQVAFTPPAWARRVGTRPALAAFLVWRACRRTRRHLSILDDRALADVGLTRAQQRGECAKPFWQL
jgi:uncharacterized protein YjiS (DUF1127 family)